MTTHRLFLERIEFKDDKEEVTLIDGETSRKLNRSYLVDFHINIIYFSLSFHNFFLTNKNLLVSSNFLGN